MASDYYKRYGSKGRAELMPGGPRSGAFGRGDYSDLAGGRRGGWTTDMPFMSRFGQFRRKDRIIPTMEETVRGFGEMQQAFQPHMQAALSSFETAESMVGRMGDVYKDLPGQLRRGALAQTTGAQVAGMQAARTAGGGRGGMAYGGGGAAMASRAAAQGAVGQSAALAGALNQATGMQGQMAAQQAQMQTGLIGQRAQLGQMAMMPRQQYLQYMGDMSKAFEGSYVQRTGQNMANRRAWIGAGSQVLSSMIPGK